jgi:hypothetical protein
VTVVDALATNRANRDRLSQRGEVRIAGVSVMEGQVNLTAIPKEDVPARDEQDYRIIWEARHRVLEKKSSPNAALAVRWIDGLNPQGAEKELLLEVL